jgi:hypothetical protein
MERQPAIHNVSKPVPKTGKTAGQGHYDYDTDESRQQMRREEAEREPWSGSRREKIELPGEDRPYKEPISQTDITAKYH